MLGKWKRAIDKRNCISALFMVSQIPLITAFDTINYDLMLVTLKAYDLSKEALNLMKKYLKD